MWQALHLDGLADQTPERGLRGTAEAHVHPLREEVQAKGLFAAAREQRSQDGVKRRWRRATENVILRFCAGCLVFTVLLVFGDDIKYQRNAFV